MLQKMKDERKRDLKRRVVDDDGREAFDPIGGGGSKKRSRDDRSEEEGMDRRRGMKFGVSRTADDGSRDWVSIKRIARKDLDLGKERMDSDREVKISGEGRSDSGERKGNPGGATKNPGVGKRTFAAGKKGCSEKGGAKMESMVKSWPITCAPLFRVATITIAKFRVAPLF